MDSLHDTPPIQVSAPSHPHSDTHASDKMFRLPAWLPPLLYFLLALCFLWRSSFLGEAFLPARLLGHIAPWKSIPQGDTLPPWNPLRWDGIGQFYPWRHFAHETVRQGIVPLWNPYQFCGTPFVANSQSAVFYPGNLLFYLIPTVWAFGASSLLHLTLCGWFTYLLLRRLGAGEAGALLSGCAFAFSAWEVQWLQLPTFLATSCWIPLLLRQIHVLSAAPPDKNRFPSICALGSVIGLMLLGGHLQIAFYGLLAGTLFALSLLGIRLRQQGRTFGIAYLFRLIVALKLGILLALPQLLPSIELSRMSHRQASPTVAGYTAYVEYALPTGALMGLTVPSSLAPTTIPPTPTTDSMSNTPPTARHSPYGTTRQKPPSMSVSCRFCSHCSPSPGKESTGSNSSSLAHWPSSHSCSR